MPRPLTKGPAITLRLPIEVDEHVRARAAAVNKPVGTYLAERLTASYGPKDTK
jgi:hypothetical protein